MSKVNYRIKGYVAHSEQDSFENGCFGETKHQSSDSYQIDCPTFAELLKTLSVDFAAKRGEVAADFTEYWGDFILNSCDENGRVDIQVMQTKPFQCAWPSTTTMEQFKAGKRNLWLTTYTFNVERIETEIDLLEPDYAKLHFETLADEVTWINDQPNKEASLKGLIAANIDNQEYGFAAELITALRG